MCAKIIKSSIEVKTPLHVVFYTFFQFELLAVFKKLKCIPGFLHTIPIDLNLQRGYEHTIYFEHWNTRLLIFMPELLLSSQVECFISQRFLGLCKTEYQFCFFDRVNFDRSEIGGEYQFKFKSKKTAIVCNVTSRRSIRDRIERFLQQIADQLNSST